MFVDSLDLFFQFGNFVFFLPQFYLDLRDFLLQFKISPLQFVFFEYIFIKLAFHVPNLEDELILLLSNMLFPNLKFVVEPGILALHGIDVGLEFDDFLIEFLV